MISAQQKYHAMPIALLLWVFQKSTMPSAIRTFAIYGFGRAGRSLAISLCSLPNSQVLAFSRRSDGWQPFATRLDIKLAEDEDHFFELMAQEVPEALFIAVSDDVIEQIADRLKQAPSLPKFIAHLSGVLSCHQLDALDHRALTAQFHPLASLDGLKGIPQNCLIGVNSESNEAQAYFMTLARELSCNAAQLKTGDQILYHAAAVLTGNLSLALVSMSQKLLQHCGIDGDQARIALSLLLKSAAIALEKDELGNALTGPLARGDIHTILKHRQVLAKPEISAEITNIYALLSNELVDEIKLPEDLRSEMRSILHRSFEGL